MKVVFVCFGIAFILGMVAHFVSTEIAIGTGVTFVLMLLFVAMIGA